MVKPDYIKVDVPNEIIDEIYNKGIEIQNIYTDIVFSPIDRNGLHMTICFLDTAIKERKINVEEVNNLMKSFNFEKYANMQLTFSGYDLFPDTKKNLIVAKCT